MDKHPGIDGLALASRVVERASWREPADGLMSRLLQEATLTRAETEEGAERFEATFPEFEPMVLAHPGTGKAMPRGRCQVWPQAWGGGAPGGEFNWTGNSRRFR